MRPLRAAGRRAGRHARPDVPAPTASPPGGARRGARDGSTQTRRGDPFRMPLSTARSRQGSDPWGTGRRRLARALGAGGDGPTRAREAVPRPGERCSRPGVRPSRRARPRDDATARRRGSQAPRSPIARRVTVVDATDRARPREVPAGVSDATVPDRPGAETEAIGACSARRARMVERPGYTRARSDSALPLRDGFERPGASSARDATERPGDASSSRTPSSARAGEVGRAPPRRARARARRPGPGTSGRAPRRAAPRPRRRPPASAAEATRIRTVADAVLAPSIPPIRRRIATSSATVPAMLTTAVESGMPQVPRR